LAQMIMESHNLTSAYHLHVTRKTGDMVMRTRELMVCMSSVRTEVRCPSIRTQAERKNSPFIYLDIPCFIYSLCIHLYTIELFLSFDYYKCYEHVFVALFSLN
jgi:hypothetical protein